MAWLGVNGCPEVIFPSRKRGKQEGKDPESTEGEGNEFFILNAFIAIHELNTVTISRSFGDRYASVRRESALLAQVGINDPAGQIHE